MGEGGRLESSALPSRDCWHKVIRTPSSLASPRPSPPATLRGPGSPTIVCFSRLCPLAARAQPRRQATSTRCRLGVHPHLGPRSFAVAAPSNALVPPLCPAVSTRKRKSAHLFLVSCAPPPACPLSTHPCRGPVAHTAPLPQNASARPCVAGHERRAHCAHAPCWRGRRVSRTTTPIHLMPPVYLRRRQ